MVTKKLWIGCLLLSTTLGSIAAGCSPSKWWGEGRRRIVMLREKTSGKSCPKLDLLITGSEQDSVAAFKCLKEQMSGIWKQIETEKTQFLSNDEIAILIRNQIINIPGDQERVIARLFAFVTLLGFKEGIDKAQLDNWLNWLETHRSKIRTIYQKATLRVDPFVYQDAIDTASALSDALSVMNWEMTSDQLGRLIIEIIEIKNPGNTKYVERAVAPAGKIVREALGMLCVELNETPIHIWKVNEIGQCLVRLGRGLAPGAKWFEFVANKTHDITQPELVEVRDALDNLQKVVQDWLAECDETASSASAIQPGKVCNKYRKVPLTKLHTENFIELSKAMGAPPPEHFIDDLELMSFFPGRSNEREITPQTLAVFLQIVRNWQTSLIGGIQYYVDAAKNGKCENPEAKYWKDCVLKYTSELRESSASINTAVRVKNPHWGQTTAPLDGYRFSKIMFFKAMSDAIIDSAVRTFGAKDRCIKAFADKDSKNILAKFLTAGLRMGDTMSRLIGNISRQLHQKTLFDTSAGSTLMGGIEIESLSTLISAGSDLFIEFDENLEKEKSNIFKNVVGRLGNGPEGPTCVYWESLTALLNFADTLVPMRASYLKTITDFNNSRDIRVIPEEFIQKSEHSDEYMVHRKAVMNSRSDGMLAELIRIHFPRTYENCMAWGFEKSCGIALDEIVSNPYGHSKYIKESELDILTLVLAGIEGLVDTCDFDHDGKLRTSSQLTYYDELDCAFSRATDIVKRLMGTNIIKWDLDRKFYLTKGMTIANFGLILRAPGKVLLARGKVDNPFLGFLTWWYHNEASIGSLYGALSDLLDSCRARGIPDEECK